MMNPEDISIERAAFKVRAEAAEASLLAHLSASRALRSLGLLGPALHSSVNAENNLVGYQNILRDWSTFETQAKINIPPV